MTAGLPREREPRRDVEHGIEAAYYSNSPTGYLPMLECSCGFRTSNACITWAEAGEELDTHLVVAERAR